MITYDEKGNIVFSKLTDEQLLKQIQEGIIKLSFEREFVNREVIRDRTYEDIHELYMRLWLTNELYERLKVEHSQLVKTEL